MRSRKSKDLTWVSLWYVTECEIWMTKVGLKLEWCKLDVEVLNETMYTKNYLLGLTEPIMDDLYQQKIFSQIADIHLRVSILETKVIDQTNNFQHLNVEVSFFIFTKCPMSIWTTIICLSKSFIWKNHIATVEHWKWQSNKMQVRNWNETDASVSDYIQIMKYKDNNPKW